MTIIKSYTDLEQSKKLAKILPLESADMIIISIGDREGVKTTTMSKETFNILRTPFTDIRNTIPCWSFAALIDVLPNNKHINTTISRGSWKVETAEYLPNVWWCEYEDEENDKEINISADNPVDACYKMIMKLNELNLL